MRKQKIIKLSLLVVLCLALIASLTSCLADMDVGNTELSEQFMEHYINNEREEAYELIKSTVTPADFNNYWAAIRTLAKGATDYEMEQIGWNVSLTNGRTVSVSAYEVHLNNGNDLLLRVTTYDNITGIAGLYINDITEFVSRTDSYVPGVNIGLIIFTVLMIAFTIWMIVDCARRNMKRKALWIILILIGITFTVTVGETNGLKFMISLIAHLSSIAADPGILAVQIQLSIPVGAIVYFFMRKRLTLKPPADGIAEIIEPSANAEEKSEEEPPADNSL